MSQIRVAKNYNLKASNISINTFKSVYIIYNIYKIRKNRNLIQAKIQYTMDIVQSIYIGFDIENIKFSNVKVSFFGTEKFPLFKAV